MTPVEQIKSRLSVVDVVSWYVKLARAGSNFKAPCPFHAEKTPSFFVSPARDVWHCFGCGIGGDQFRFIMQIEGMDFREALQLLAERAGVELRHENPEERSERARLFSLLEEAALFYQAEFSRSAAVQEYLVGRGVHPETIAKFRIGYAPPETSGWRQFMEHALKKGYKRDELEKTGLAMQRQPSSPNAYTSASHTHYDRFRNRIMFPITDPNGRMIGFGGRIFSAEGGPASGRGVTIQQGDTAPPAKYINTPQTILYDKSRTLYGFDRAKTAMRKENACILVEGYMDAIMAHQAGTEHTVAVSGTALTRDQLTMIRRLCNTIILSFDMDDAGESATRRSIDLALEMGFDVRAIAIPSGKDPADLVQSNVVVWRRVAEETTHIVAYFLEKALAKHNTRTVEGKRAVIESVLPLVARITREVEKAHWVSLISSRISVREESVWHDMRSFQTSGAKSYTPPGAERRPISSSGVEQNRIRVLEDRILGILYAYGIPVPASVMEHVFSSENARTLFAALSLPQGSPSAFVAAITDEALRSFANRLMFEAEMLVSAESAAEECAACVAELERERVKEKLARLTTDIRKAEEAGNSQQLPYLIEEFQKTSKYLIH